MKGRRRGTPGRVERPSRLCRPHNLAMFVVVAAALVWVSGIVFFMLESPSGETGVGGLRGGGHGLLASQPLQSAVPPDAAPSTTVTSPPPASTVASSPSTPQRPPPQWTSPPPPKGSGISLADAPELAPPTAHSVLHGVDTTRQGAGAILSPTLWTFPSVRVYVYDLPAQYNTHLHADLARDAKRQGFHAKFEFEKTIHDQLLLSAARVTDPAQADVFFVPVYVGALLAGQGTTSRGRSRARSSVLQAVQWVRDSGPHWDASGGADHVFVFAYDQGICCDLRAERADESERARLVMATLANSIVLSPNGDADTACYRAGTDVVVPPTIDEAALVELFAGWGPAGAAAVAIEGAEAQGKVRVDPSRHDAYQQLALQRTGVHADLASLATAVDTGDAARPILASFRGTYTFDSPATPTLGVRMLFGAPQDQQAIGLPSPPVYPARCADLHPPQDVATPATSAARSPGSWGLRPTKQKQHAGTSSAAPMWRPQDVAAEAQSPTLPSTLAADEYCPATCDIELARSRVFSRGVRQRLVMALAGRPGFLFGAESVDMRQYASELRSSVFCLVPRGHAGWTVRLFEALLAGCIPVVYASQTHLPFAGAGLIDWASAIVRIHEADYAATERILLALSPEEVRAKQIAVRQAALVVSYSAPLPASSDAAASSDASTDVARLSAAALTGSSGGGSSAAVTAILHSVAAVLQRRSANRTWYPESATSTTMAVGLHRSALLRSPLPWLAGQGRLVTRAVGGSEWGDGLTEAQMRMMVGIGITDMAMATPGRGAALADADSLSSSSLSEVAARRPTARVSPAVIPPSRTEARVSRREPGAFGYDDATLVAIAHGTAFDITLVHELWLHWRGRVSVAILLDGAPDLLDEIIIREIFPHADIRVIFRRGGHTVSRDDITDDVIATAEQPAGSREATEAAPDKLLQLTLVVDTARRATPDAELWNVASQRVSTRYAVLAPKLSMPTPGAKGAMLADLRRRQSSAPGAPRVAVVAPTFTAEVTGAALGAWHKSTTSYISARALKRLGAPLAVHPTGSIALVHASVQEQKAGNHAFGDSARCRVSVPAGALPCTKDQAIERHEEGGLRFARAACGADDAANALADAMLMRLWADSSSEAAPTLVSPVDVQRTMPLVGLEMPFPAFDEVLMGSEAPVVGFVSELAAAGFSFVLSPEAFALTPEPLLRKWLFPGYFVEDAYDERCSLQYACWHAFATRVARQHGRDVVESCAFSSAVLPAVAEATGGACPVNEVIGSIPRWATVQTRDAPAADDGGDRGVAA